MTPQSPDDRESRFAMFLDGLATSKNGGALAALRRGLSSDEGASAGMHRYVAGWLKDDDRPWDEQAFYLVAALFGRYPRAGTAKHNFGGSWRELFHLKDNSESVERRFVALLAADADSVGIHLRHAVSLFASEDIAVDWAQLLRDMRRWGQPGHAVARRWAREFWKHAGVGESEPEKPSEAVVVSTENQS